MKAIRKTILALGVVITAIGVLGMLGLFAYSGITGDFHPFGMASPNLLDLAIAWTGLILCMIGTNW